ncbi:MAG TPA: PQQ-binding-like beta-propeller repeat protein [Kribbella sp.]
MHGLRVVPAGLLLLALVACSVDKVAPYSPPGTSSTTNTGTAPVSDPTPSPVGPVPAWTVKYDVRHAPVAVGDVVVFHEQGKTLRAVRRAGGGEVWHRPMPEGSELLSLTPTQGGVVARARRGEFQESVEVVDPATGQLRWSSQPVAHAAVYQDAIYLDTCGKSSRPCTITNRDARTGKVRWTIPWRGAGGVSTKAIGSREGRAPVVGQYVATYWGIPDATNPSGFYRVLETATGKAMPAKLPTFGWSNIAVGNLLVSTDQDGIADCGVRIRAADIRTGRSRQLAELQSAKRADGQCLSFLANYEQDQELLGTGSRIAAVTGDRAVVYDLSTAKIAWTAPTAGVPVDGDDRSLLVRTHPDKGTLALLDLANGRTRWTAPDPGVGEAWSHWHTVVTHRLVAVDGYQSGQSAVLVYEATSGKLLGRIRGKVAGAGDDWVATTFNGNLSLTQY